MGINVCLQMGAADVIEMNLPFLVLNQRIHSLCKEFPVFTLVAIKSKMID
jgi:hypothetical protein